ncbi:sigma-54-dependent Fis family transcriptional regulator [Desulfosarcina widdelii]|uniref:Sigma-54-dependent Fis family transcriptional regulator n=1 Tax=Desulfosarcina widdelii TaxID=947919 RepID=A0A5K7Z836_9BACT|nr:sigma 54-interacting transcriptional regulator [Desulfosarcina widdelii]BBO72657.1 sigma-54-dependent Fis family transcriptional regulator [Desulfosarcina widdelii]
MQTNNVTVGIFASSQPVIKRIKAITAHQQDQIHINTQGLDDAIPEAIEMQRNGIEVIISRRGTAHLLRENLRIPVLSFPHRSLDILVSLKAAASISRRILLPTFRQKMDGMLILEELLDIEIVQKIYNDRQGLERVISQSKRKGCEVVVGGSVSEQISETLGIRFVGIRTSDEDMAATIENAKSVAISGREERATARRYRSIIDAASDGIIAVNDKGRIITINSKARQILHIGKDEVMNHSITDLIPNCPVQHVLATKKPVQDLLGQIHNDQYVFSHLPVLLDDEAIGAVSTFRDIGKIMRTENVVRSSLSKGLVAKYNFDELVYDSLEMEDLLNVSREYAKTESTILLVGETGTGKEIFAHGIHNLSRRSRHPFVSINCTALPEQLLESELFGYEEGSFTGSKKGGKPGQFEIAHKGTIFLDEIDSTPKAMQIRLLRVLQEREILRVGGDRKIPVDVRIIAAASRDLHHAVLEGKFRADLFYRINVLCLQIPPLRRRQEDIPVLLDYFIKLFSNRQNFKPIMIPEEYVYKLKQYDWPGNVRQLRNFAERLVINCSLHRRHDMLNVLYRELIQKTILTQSSLAKPKPSFELKNRIKETTLKSEKAIIIKALSQARYSKSKAAKLLGISRTTLWRKIKEHSID